MTLSIQDTINEKLDQRFDLKHLEVVNESGNHNVPPGSETHFKVVMVSTDFEGARLLTRHRAVNEALADELAGGVHALALHTYTPDEWQARFGNAPMSPPCLGGKASEGNGS
ncbi:MAG: BolA/IbaG family iron-sulfur metabolism protein [Gammaproteobacteria bacterium]|jgi:BolA protein|nr:MAG: BolA/IbaG family iron-sulfur metabolism protein [Gammaproteobacteria bacterium]